GDVRVAALADGRDLRGDLVLGGEVAVVDVQVADGEGRRVLDRGRDLEGLLLADDVVVAQRVGTAVERVELGHGQRADDDQRDDHRAERNAETLRQAQVVEAGHASSGKQEWTEG